ncbi:helix-hairpin-helix domain-containing protein [bacterium]|nr:helix-hairpin-helix domain-containing protein [bacterium]
MNGSRYLYCFVFFITGLSWAQDADSLDLDENESSQERLLDNYTESSDASTISEILEYYLEHPLDINAASRSDFENIPELSSIVIQNILNYRQRQRFKTVRELLKVSDMTRETFVAIKDFLTVNPENLIKPYEISYRQRTKHSLDPSRDVKEGEFDGNNYQLYNRLNVEFKPNSSASSTIRGGGVIEKDAGETNWADHRVGFVEFNRFSLIRKMIVGNYQLEFGQGIALWSASGLSKGSETVDAVKRRGNGIRSYNYATENSAYFGGAVQFEKFKNTALTVFASQANFDASFNDDGSVNSILTDGFHRDSSEKAKQDFLREKIAGVNVQTELNASRFGAVHYTTWYDRDFVVTDPVRSRYDLTGKVHGVTSIYADVIWNRFNIFGELARDRDGASAYNAGWITSWHKIEMIVFYRNYAKNFHSVRGYAFGEQNGNTQNEEGIYTGIKAQVARGTSVSAYYDLFRYPWRSYNVPKPVRGNDFFAEAEHKLTKQTVITLRYKNETKDEAYTSQDILGRDITVIGKSNTRRIRYQLAYRVVPEIQLKSRVEQAWYDLANRHDQGILFQQDIKIQPRKNLTIYGRLSFFDTDNFQTAIYEYENDVEGSFTNTALYEKGKRWYLLIKYRWAKSADVSIKYWEMYKDGVSQIGSGGSAVNGNKLRRVAMSLDVQI